MSNIRNFSLLIGLFLFFSIFCVELFAVESAPLIRYSTEDNRLSIQANNHSLDMILSLISLQTGMEIFMSPLSETKVSLTLEDRDLDQALKQLAKVSGVNHMLIYGKSNDMETVVIGMKVFPKGSFSSANLQRVVPVELEAITQSNKEAKEAKNAPEADIRDYAKQRWNERLSLMPVEKREKMETKIEERLERKAASVQKRNEKTEKRTQQKLKHATQRKAREEVLRAENPEKYELYLQQRKENRQQALEIYQQHTQENEQKVN